MKDNNAVKKLIKEICNEISDLLCRKNDAYGNSFMYPANIFSKDLALAQIHVRIDDKLNRISKGQNTDKVQEDTKMDLIGYLILEQVLLRQEQKPHKTLFEKHKPITKSEVEKFTVLQNLEEIVEGQHD